MPVQAPVSPAGEKMKQWRLPCRAMCSQDEHRQDDSVAMQQGFGEQVG
jgi:hypothetical protein